MSPLDVDTTPPLGPPPLALRLFGLALMVPACGINGVLLTFAIPGTAQFGIPGMLVGGLIGGILGVLPARWLSQKIHEGLNE